MIERDRPTRTLPSSSVEFVPSGFANKDTSDQPTPEQAELTRLKVEDRKLTEAETELEMAALIVAHGLARKAYERGKEQRAKRRHEIGIQKILAGWERKDNLIARETHDTTQIVNTRRDPEAESFTRKRRRELAEEEYLRRNSD